jgi:hypothetical protein
VSSPLGPDDDDSPLIEDLNQRRPSQRRVYAESINGNIYIVGPATIYDTAFQR